MQKVTENSFHISEVGLGEWTTVARSESHRKLLESMRMKSKFPWRPTKVRDTIKIQCPTRNASHNDQSHPERISVWSQTSKGTGMGLPKPFEVHLIKPNVLDPGMDLQCSTFALLG